MVWCNWVDGLNSAKNLVSTCKVLVILKWTDTKTVHFLYDSYRKFKRKDVKPTYYLWRNDFSSQEECEAERKKYADIGFRVVTFLDGDANANIHDGIKTLVKNHWDKE